MDEAKNIIENVRKNNYMIRILVYGISNTVGGVSEYMMNLYRNVDRKKINFDFIITGDSCVYEKEINDLGGQIFYITPKKESLTKNVKELLGVMKKCKRNHKIFYFNTSGIYYNIPFVVAKLMGYKVITHAHNTKCTEMKEYAHILHYINRIIVRNMSNYCFTCSELAGEWVYGKKYYLRNSNNIKLINNAVDCEKFKYDIDKMIKNRKELGISKDQFVIGNVGRLDYQKNHKFLLKIFKEVVKMNEDSILLIIGDGSLREDLIEEAKELDILNKVRFLGVRRDINELMQAMDVFILPSLFEGFPITLVEAQAAGLRCIASDTITKKSAITDCVNFISLEDSTQKWAEKIINSRGEKKDNYSELCEKGFDIKSQGKDMEKFLLNV